MVSTSSVPEGPATEAELLKELRSKIIEYKESLLEELVTKRSSLREPSPPCEQPQVDTASSASDLKRKPDVQPTSPLKKQKVEHTSPKTSSQAPVPSPEKVPLSPVRSPQEIASEFQSSLDSYVETASQVASKTGQLTRKRQLPRAPPSSRRKSHHDLLLDEMRWMATDFSETRKWRLALSSHLARQARDKLDEQERQEEQLRRKKGREVASLMAAFWRTMERTAARTRMRVESGEKTLDDTKEEQSNGQSAHVEVEVVPMEGRTVDQKALSKMQRQVQDVLSLLTQEDKPEAIQSEGVQYLEEVFDHQLNAFVNDQVGMGSSLLVSKFLQARMLDENIHLIVVDEYDVPKWLSSLSQYFSTEELQVYDGPSSRSRERLRRQWDSNIAALDVVRLVEQQVDRIKCVVCPSSVLATDMDQITAFDKWGSIVMDFDPRNAVFQDIQVVQRLSSVQQSQTRVLMSSALPESWGSSALQQAYASFLFALFEQKGGCVSYESLSHTFSSRRKSASAIDALCTVSTSKETRRGCTISLFLLHAAGLRRRRSDREHQLGKVEETSVACKLTSSQQAQYRSAVSCFSSSTFKDWMQLLLRLRSICNCVELPADKEKLAQADRALFESCSGKLSELCALLLRLVKEEKRVALYVQLESLLPVLELLLDVLGISAVTTVGRKALVQKSMRQFALKQAQVALLPTRLQKNGRASVPFGADAVVVVDGDWNAMVDAKLRASFAQVAGEKLGETLAVYRLHTEESVEASLLQVGSCLSEKTFASLSPQELLQVASVQVETPGWWGKPSLDKREVKEAERGYCQSGLEDQELDPEEHLLLAQTDELSSVEWYAVNWLEKVKEHKDQHVDEAVSYAMQNVNSSSFEQLAVLDKQQRLLSTPLYVDGLDSLRRNGDEVHYEVYDLALDPDKKVMVEVGDPQYHQQTYAISYQEAEPPKPVEPSKKGRKPKHAKLSSSRRSSDKRKMELSDLDDDDFWGDTNLDALDATSWDDPSSLLLGPGLDDAGAISSSASEMSAAQTSSGRPHKSTKKAKAARNKRSGAEAVKKDKWSARDDALLVTLVRWYGSNWALVSHCLNSRSSSSAWCYRRRSPRQCYDRYNKLLATGKSGAPASSFTGIKWKGEPVPDDELEMVVGVSPDEVLVKYQDALGVPPPKVHTDAADTFVHQSAQERKQQADAAASLQTAADKAKRKNTSASLRNSFDAIVQSMKKKVPPPALPTQSAAHLSNLPAPHKSHSDLIALLPSHALPPDDVIRKSKEAAVAAVQAAAAVASANSSAPISNTQSPSVSVTSTPTLTPSIASTASPSVQHLSAVSLGPRSSYSSASQDATTASSALDASHASYQTGSTSTWGGQALGGSSSRMNSSSSQSLLAVLDRQPAVKLKIQSILNRRDASEAQKVAMIARLLSNSNALPSSTVLSQQSSSSSSVSAAPTSEEMAMPDAMMSDSLHDKPPAS